MQKGSISGPGELDVVWNSAEDKALGIFSRSKDLQAYRCHKCGKVELIIEVDQK